MQCSEFEIPGSWVRVLDVVLADISVGRFYRMGRGKGEGERGREKGEEGTFLILTVSFYEFLYFRILVYQNYY